MLKLKVGENRESFVKEVMKHKLLFTVMVILTIIVLCIIMKVK